MMRSFLLKTAAVVASIASAGSAMAQDAVPPKTLIDDAVITQARKMLENPVVEISIAAQNERYATLSQSEIDKLDKQWRNERKSDDQPLVAAVMSSPLSNYLTQIQAASGGVYTEMFIMDAKGLNVGQSAITSDFWQGDEAKYQKTYPEGRGAIFIDEPEFNDDAKNWRTQANMTISGSNGSPIGVLTIEYNLTELARRKGTP